MKALVYEGPGEKSWKEVPNPTIQRSTDVIVKMQATTICMTAGLYGPSKVIALDIDDARLKRAADFGATDTVNSAEVDWKEQVLALTDGLGVDVAIEAVGVPQTFTMCTDIVRPGD